MTEARSSDATLLFPPFRARVEAGLAKAHAAGVMAYLFEGWRAPGRQTELHAQGRTTPGPIVTNAVAWASWHQYGLAVDLAFGGPGSWNWAGDWQKLGAVMQAEGLEWYGAPGAAFHETPHFQMTLGLKLADCAMLAKTEGSLAVWARATVAYEASIPKVAAA